MKKLIITSAIATLAFVSVAAASFDSNLSVGSTGASVSALQTWLISAGFDIPSISAGTASKGYFGQQTKTAVIAYQKSVSVPTTGFVGPLTRAALNGTNSVAVNPAFVCPTGMTCTVNPGTVVTTPGTPSAGITTPGVEGILTVTQGPVSNSVVNVGQSNVPVLAVRAQAQNSDIAIQRLTLNLGTNTTIYNKIYRTLHVMNGTTVVASVDLNPSTVTQSGSNYLVTITGFSSVVPKGTYKDFVVTADLYSAIDTTYRSLAYTISVASQGVRGIDGAGLSQYAGDSTIAQAITINSSLTDNTIANISTDPTTPQTQSVPVTDTTNGQYLKLPVLVFNVGAQNDNVHLHQVYVNISGTGTGTTTAAYLYQGSTQVGSAAVTGGVAKFTNLVDGTAGATVNRDQVLPYTVKVDVTGVTSGTLTVTPTLDTTSNLVIYNSIDSTVTNVNGSAPGYTTTVLGKGPAFTIASAPIATVSGTNQSGQTNSTSTITATFNVNAQAVGSNVYFSSQASSTNPMFTFKVFNGAGTDVTSSLVNKSSGFIIPSAGVITVGQPANSFYIPQQNIANISGITFQFAGKDVNGAPLTAGPYSVEIAGINWSSTAAGSATSTTSFDLQSAWRTNGVNP